VSAGRGAAPATVEMVCIACPLACRLAVSLSGRGDVTVTGHRCTRGEAYGTEEVRAPRRILTAVVRTDSAEFPCAPVRTDRAISRELVNQLLSELDAMQVSLPIRQGQAAREDFDGARVVFTRTLPPDEVSPIREPGAEAEGQDEVSGFQKVT
jgi:CxxC motif-containing protein